MLHKSCISTQYLHNYHKLCILMFTVPLTCLFSLTEIDCNKYYAPCNTYFVRKKWIIHKNLLMSTNNAIYNAKMNTGHQKNPLFFKICIFLETRCCILFDAQKCFHLKSTIGFPRVEMLLRNGNGNSVIKWTLWLRYA